MAVGYCDDWDGSYKFRGGLVYLERSAGGAWTPTYVPGASNDADAPIGGWTNSSIVSDRPRLAVSPSGDIALLATGYWASGGSLSAFPPGIYHRASGSGIWQYSFADASFNDFTTAWRGSGPVFLTMHGSLELVSTDAASFWKYDTADLGPSDGGEMDIAVDTSGEVRVCFVRSGNLMVF